MSWLPIFNSWVVFVAVISLFLWKLGGVLLFILMSLVSVYYLISEVFSLDARHLDAFWLFLLSEVAVFATLFVTSLWNEDSEVESISDWEELPFLGCFLLIGSSICATAYHHVSGFKFSPILLVMTMLLGTGFVLLQLWEFYDCECDLSYCVYHAGSFCTVGLHFTHVLLGVLGLLILLTLGIETVDWHYINLVVWYWHFVDYVWLFVFLIIYVI
uniref:Cytochrome c oxidase subunit 3 n=1 Tax=Plagiorchis multiglandularis TaxID=3026102 RepID=A0AA50DF41_9TREM|nr:cytochrome c oxidase subunit III [Plagiorchis multiglandularis]WCQ78406.1 cytochrome c oxidase subunit III [Plagiorchis multiglandularis]WLS55015.1 cytochrome c oxidase subunit III [Plagiorchis multiglandularis]